MIIVSWNCAGAFRKKTEFIDNLDPDLIIIQECEDPARSTSDFRLWAGDNYLWSGNNKNKGIGVFSRNGEILESTNWPDDGILEHFHSFRFCGIDFVGVWTKQANSPNFRYIGQFWKYLQLNRDRINSERPVIIGDFNSNSRWDEWDRWWNHTDVVRELSEIGFVSAYHYLTGESQGEESTPTFYFRRDLSRPYHIDYCFVDKALAKISDFNIGRVDEWISVSDHMPLCLMFDY